MSSVELRPQVKTVTAGGGTLVSVGKKAAQKPSVQPIKLHLKAWRKYRMLSQEQVAARIGTTTATISRIENQKQNWDQAFLAAACEVLRCDPVDLIWRDPTSDGPWSVWDNLGPVERQQWVAVGKALKPTGTDG